MNCIKFSFKYIIPQIYCEELYRKARTINYINGIEKVGLDVCYRDNPVISTVFCLKPINQIPYKNKKYHNKNTSNKNKQAEAEIRQKISVYQKI
jgi:hypothetical protein